MSGAWTGWCGKAGGRPSGRAGAAAPRRGACRARTSADVELLRRARRGGGRRPGGRPASRGGATRTPARRSGAPSSHAARNPASNASPAPVVSDANRGRVAMSDRIGVEPSPRARIDAPCAPRLMTTTGAKASSPSSAQPPRSASASPAVANRRSGATDRRSAWAAFCPAASKRPARGEVHADRRAVHPGQLGRPPPGRTQRLAQQRVGRQVQDVDAAEPGRLEVARVTARPPRPGRRRTSARHCRPCR